MFRVQSTDKVPLQLLRPLILLGAAFALMVCGGCKGYNEADVSGVYCRNGRGISDTLTLSSNGTFQQTITFTNGSNWAMSGRWIFKREVIELDQSYVAFDSEHNTIVIPPQHVTMQNLWVEKGRLVKNEYEPKWLKK